LIAEVAISFQIVAEAFRLSVTSSSAKNFAAPMMIILLICILSSWLLPFRDTVYQIGRKGHCGWSGKGSGKLRLRSFSISFAVKVEDDGSKQFDLWKQQCTGDNILRRLANKAKDPF
jgi:hypothetical protein